VALALEATDEKVGSEKANAMFDTLNVTSRPQILESLETRDATTLAFLAHGGLVSALNIAGLYENYETVAIGVAAFLGLINVAVGTYELASGGVADDERPGFAHERSIILYTTAYLAAVVWLSCRFSPLYPAGLAGLDAPLCVASACVYVYGLLSPLATLTRLHEQLTPTEARLQGSDPRQLPRWLLLLLGGIMASPGSVCRGFELREAGATNEGDGGEWCSGCSGITLRPNSCVQ
jgi:hypothetical protein